MIEHTGPLCTAGLAAAGAAAGHYAARLAVPYLPETAPGTGLVAGRDRVVRPAAAAAAAGAERTVAAATGAVFGIFGWRFGATPILPAYLFFALVGALLAVIDIAVHRLPDPFTLPAYPAAAALMAIAVPFTDAGRLHFTHAVLGMAAMWALYAIQHLVAPSAMGWGDVKLSGVLGLYLGWCGRPAWTLGLLLAFGFGGVVSIGLLVTGRAGRRARIPFGPFMLAGALAAIIATGS